MSRAGCRSAGTRVDLRFLVTAEDGTPIAPDQGGENRGNSGTLSPPCTGRVGRVRSQRFANTHGSRGPPSHRAPAGRVSRGPSRAATPPPARGELVLFVGTKKQAQDVMREESERA